VKEVKAADVKPAEPEEQVQTLDEFRKEQAKKAPKNDKLNAREVKEDDKKWGVTGEFKKTEPENMQIGNVSKAGKTKDRKQKKAISIDQFVKEVGAKDSATPSSPPAASAEPTSPQSDQQGGGRGQRRFDGQGRGAYRGGGRGNRGGSRGGRGRGRGRGRGNGPDVLDQAAFPKLGAQ